MNPEKIYQKTAKRNIINTKLIIPYSIHLMIEQGSPGYKVFTQDMHAITFKSKK